MKITVSCLPEEVKADNILELLQKRYPKARVHQKAANSSYIVTSFTVKSKKMLKNAKNDVYVFGKMKREQKGSKKLAVGRG